MSVSRERRPSAESPSSCSCPLLAPSGKDHLPGCRTALSRRSATRAEEPVLHHSARGDHRDRGPHRFRYESSLNFHIKLHSFVYSALPVRSRRKVVTGRSSVQTCGTSRGLDYHWRDQYRTDWSGWPAEQGSHHSSGASALHRHCQVIHTIMYCINELNLWIFPPLL